MNNSVKIQHVDSEISNYYDEKRHTIVIDEKLVEYPKAHRFVLNHELEHSEVDRSRFPLGALKEVWIDMKAKYNIALKRKEAVKEYYDYKDRISGTLNMETAKTWANIFVYVFLILLSLIPLGVMYLSSWVWRRLRE